MALGEHRANSLFKFSHCKFVDFMSDVSDKSQKQVSRAA